MQAGKKGQRNNQTKNEQLITVYTTLHKQIKYVAERP